MLALLARTFPLTHGAPQRTVKGHVA
jgi:hypothetical protein